MTTTTVNFTVTAPAGTVPPIGANQYSTITSNSMVSSDILTPADTAAGWTQNKWLQCLIETFGSGTFVPGYGVKGSWVCAAQGGDAYGQVYDEVSFDFATLTWSRYTTANGAPNAVNKRSGIQANGDAPLEAYFYRASPGVSTAYPGVPQGDQPYRVRVGVGSKIIIPILCAARGSVDGSEALAGLRYGKWASEYDCSTRTYAQFSTNIISTALSGFGIEGSVVHDTYTDGTYPQGRLLFLHNQPIYTKPLPALNLSTKTWVSLSLGATPGSSFAQNSSNWPHYIYHRDEDGAGTRRCILGFKCTTYAGQTWPNGAHVLDLNNLATGWQPVNLVDGNGQIATTAQFISPTTYTAYGYTNATSTSTQAQSVRWAKYPLDNCHYTTDGNTGTISKIAPPSNGTVNGDWTITQITPSNGSLPRSYRLVNQANQFAAVSHYTRWMYVPLLSCFAWIPGGPAPVILWRP